MKNFLDVQDKILLFDFDGTVVVTEILAKKVIDVYFHERGIRLPESFSELIVGRTWKAAVEAMQSQALTLQLKLDSSEVLLHEFRTRYREQCLDGVPLVPGFKEILPEFRKKAGRLGIVTGSEREEVELILDSHGLLKGFDQIWGFGDYEHSKPHPSPYLTALKDLRVESSQVLVFEDSKAGMESAHQAGLKFVQIAHEEHAKEPDSRSLLLIRDWKELKI